uniref:MANSC domain-containing protein n=1 Tax=Ciona savignyi TaxID=51511 RepID=H2ZBX3_CIOSA
RCDLSVIQLSGGGGGKPCCFLFSCTNHSTGKFNCLFSNHDGYNTYRKTLEPVAVQPNNDVIELQEVLETSTTSQTTTTTPQTTTISTTKPTTTESTTTTKEPTTESTTTKPTTTTTEIFTTTSTTSTTKISPTTLKRESCKKQCSHHEWSCDDGCCIHAHLVCDNTNHCNDGSDETDCDGLQSQPPLVPPTNQTLKVNPVTQKIDTDVQTHNPMVEVEKIVVEEKSLSPEQGAVLPLALGLAVTACIILMVVCRVRVMRKKLRRNGGPLRMDESDYLINGMYL